MYGLPQAGILYNKQLRDKVSQEGYYEVPHTSGLWWHYIRNTTFALVVDYFGIKYQRMDNSNHIIQALEKYYQVEVDCIGGFYCGIKLECNYEK